MAARVAEGRGLGCKTHGVAAGVPGILHLRCAGIGAWIAWR